MEAAAAELPMKSTNLDMTLRSGTIKLIPRTLCSLPCSPFAPIGTGAARNQPGWCLPVLDQAQAREAGADGNQFSCRYQLSPGAVWRDAPPHLRPRICLTSQ